MKENGETPTQCYSSTGAAASDVAGCMYNCKYVSVGQSDLGSRRVFAVKYDTMIWTQENNAIQIKMERLAAVKQNHSYTADD